MSNTQVLPPSTSCSVNAGSAMCAGWTMDACPKDIMNGELASGKRPLGSLHYKDVCKHDMKSLNTALDAAETATPESYQP